MVGWLSTAGIFALIGLGATAVRLIREGERRIGFSLAAGLVGLATVLAVLGSWRPGLYLVAAASLFAGLEVDRAGHPGRRALGLLGIAIWMVVLVIAGQSA